MSSTAHCSLSDLAVESVFLSHGLLILLSSHVEKRFLKNQHLTALWKSLGRATPRMRRPRERTCRSCNAFTQAPENEGECRGVFATFLV